MNPIYPHVVFALSLLVLGGCGSEPDLCQVGGRMNIVEEDLHEAVIQSLDAEHIPYKVQADQSICFDYARKDQIVAIVKANDTKLNPPNEITIIGGRYAEEAKRRLTAAGISFEAREKNENQEVIIILDEDRKEESYEIFENTARDVFEKGKN